MTKEETFTLKCRTLLIELWQEVQSEFVANDRLSYLAEDEIELLRNCLLSPILSYHYVLPTQLLSKVVNPEVDCRSLQVAFDSAGAFDARTIAHDVIVPFDRGNQNVLGGSPEPYVNNPLRYPGITSEFRGQQKNKIHWDLLVNILDRVESTNDQEFTAAYFKQVLLEIFKLLQSVGVTYPIPRRISFTATMDLVNRYISEKSGGERLETVTTALFKTIGNRFNLFDEVRRSKVNASDTSTGSSADIECCFQGQIQLAVEVKDKTLTITQFDTIIESSRAHKISEILFIADKGIESTEYESIQKKMSHEFASGQNVYIIDLAAFASGIFILFGESGRVEYLQSICAELERIGSSITHRRRWAELLRES